MENKKPIFRVWSIDDSCMLEMTDDNYGIWWGLEVGEYDIHVRCAEYVVCPHTLNESFEWLDCDYPVMRYTGKDDKNGVGIYECDIVEDLHGEFGNGEVFFCNSFLRYMIKFSAPNFDEYNTTTEEIVPLSDFIDSILVVGNIYEGIVDE